MRDRVRKAFKHRPLNGKRIAALLIACLFAVMGTAVFAESGDAMTPARTAPAVPEPTADFYVYDGADALSEETEAAILKRSDELDEHYGIQLVVMAVPTLGGGNAQQFAEDVYSEWDIGGAEDRGLLLVLYINDEDYWSVAGSLGPQFTNDGISDLLRTNLEPSFAKGAYDEGVMAYYNAAAALAEEYVGGVASPAPGETASPDTETSSAETGTTDGTESSGEKEDGESAAGGFFSGVLIFLLILILLALAAFAVIYLHGLSVRKKRRARRSGRRPAGNNRRGSRPARRPEDDDDPPPPDPNNDYKSFSDRY